jgi:hypothetical protein
LLQQFSFCVGRQTTNAVEGADSTGRWLVPQFSSCVGCQTTNAFEGADSTGRWSVLPLSAVPHYLAQFLCSMLYDVLHDV